MMNDVVSVVPIRSLILHVTSGSRGWSKYVCSVGAPFLGVGSLSKEGIRLNLEDMRFVQPPQLNGEVLRTRLQVNDVLVSITADLGRIGLVDERVAGGFINQHVALLRPDPTKVHPAFLSHYLSIPETRARLTSLRDLGAKVGFNLDTVCNFEIQLPPRHMQNDIVEILDTWDCGIAAAENLVTKAFQRISGLMSQYLNLCIPGTVREDMSLPLVCLGDVFSERHETGYEGETLLAITGDRGVILRDEIERRDTSAEDKSNYRLILPGDIGYNTMRMWQGVCGLSSLRGIVSPAYTVVTPTPQVIDGAFAAVLFKAPHMIEWLRRYSQGIVDDTLNLKFEQFRQIRIRLPPLDTQRRIANAIHAIRAEADVTARLAAKLRQQKQTLMTQLLSGALRVPQRKANSNVQMENANA